MAVNISTFVRMAQNGDKDAFGELYSIYAIDLYKYALYLMRNPQDAQDCVQDAVIKGYTNIKSLKKPDSFKCWILRILANECNTKLLKNSNAHCEGNEVDIPQSNDFIHHSEVWQSLDVLDNQSRQIVILSAVHQYKSNEIAKILNCSSGTVRSKLSRSLSKMRDYLKE